MELPHGVVAQFFLLKAAIERISHTAVLHCTDKRVTVIQYCYKRIIEQYAAAAAARTRVGLLLLAAVPSNRTTCVTTLVVTYHATWYVIDNNIGFICNNEISYVIVHRLASAHLIVIQLRVFDLDGKYY